MIDGNNVYPVKNLETPIEIFEFKFFKQNYTLNVRQLVNNIQFPKRQMKLNSAENAENAKLPIF